MKPNLLRVIIPVTLLITITAYWHLTAGIPATTVTTTTVAKPVPPTAAGVATIQPGQQIVTQATQTITPIKTSFTIVNPTEWEARVYWTVPGQATQDTDRVQAKSHKEINFGPTVPPAIHYVLNNNGVNLNDETIMSPHNGETFTISNEAIQKYEHQTARATQTPESTIRQPRAKGPRTPQRNPR